MIDIIKQLNDKDDQKAYEFAKKIIIESAESDKYLEMIPEFAKMLESKSSFVRARGFMLICNQAKWANNGQIDSVFNQMLPLLNDTKPTVVRQCLTALKEVILFRAEMTEQIKKAITEINLNAYKDSMSSLIKKDIEELETIFGE